MSLVVLDCSYDTLEIELFKALKKLDVLEVDRDSNDTYSFTLLSTDKEPKEATLFRSFDEIEGVTVKALAKDLEKEFNKAPKEEYRSGKSYQSKTDDELIHYACARAFQYYEMGEPVSMIPKYIKCKMEVVRHCLSNYIKPNLNRDNLVYRSDKYGNL